MGKKFFWFFAFLLMTVNSFLAAELLRTKINTKLETLAELNISSDTQPKSKVSKSSYTDYQIINERNLFQTAKPEDKKEAEKSSELVPPPSNPKPLTELKLRLLGTMVGIASPRAIILNLKNNDQNIYKEGDSLAEDATLTHIYRNKVILNHGGKEEMLLAFESELSLIGSEQKSSQDKSSSSTESSKEAHISPSARFDLGSLGKRVSQNRWELDREEVGQAIDNASQLLTQIRIIPHFNKGEMDKPDGFQISQVKQAGFFDKLGIMPGDIIKEVNGEPVNSPEKAFAAYQKFKNEPNVRILLERQNQPQTLIYDIR